LSVGMCVFSAGRQHGQNEKKRIMALHQELAQWRGWYENGIGNIQKQMPRSVITDSLQTRTASGETIRKIFFSNLETPGYGKEDASLSAMMGERKLLSILTLFSARKFLIWN
jgi:hypothetical protein